MTEREARERGAKLLKKLPGKGWKLHVWENLGWHYEARLHGLMLREDTSRFSDACSYWCGLSDVESSSGTPAYWHTNESFKTPLEAIENQMKVAANFVKMVSGVVNKIETALYAEARHHERSHD